MCILAFQSMLIVLNKKVTSLLHKVIEKILDRWVLRTEESAMRKWFPVDFSLTRII